MYVVCLCVLFLGVTNNVVSENVELSIERWNRDPIVQDIVWELGKFLKEYIAKYCKNSTNSAVWMNAEKADEHPLYVKSSTEPEEETLVLRRSFVSRLTPDNGSTIEAGSRRAASNGSDTEEDLSSDEEKILLEVEDQPKDSKSVLTADELVLSIQGPEGMRRSSITLPNDLRVIIGNYLRVRRRKRFKVHVVENNQIKVSAGLNNELYRRADMLNTNKNAYDDAEDYEKLVKRFIQVPNDKLKSGNYMKMGFKIGSVPVDQVDYSISNPIQVQLGTKQVPGFSKDIPYQYVPDINVKQTTLPSGSFQFTAGNTQPQVQKFEITEPGSKPYSPFQLSTENKPYNQYIPDVKQTTLPSGSFQFTVGNKQPQVNKFEITDPGSKPYSPFKLSTENKPYNVYQYEIPGQGQPGQPDSPYSSFKAPTDGKQPQLQYNIQQVPGQVDIPYGSSKLSPENKPYDGKVSFNGYETPGQVKRPYDTVEYSFYDAKQPAGPDVPYQQYEVPGQANNPYGSLKLSPENKPYDDKGSYNVQQYDIPGDKAPGQMKFEIPGQTYGPFNSAQFPKNDKQPQEQYSVQQVGLPGQNSPGQAKYPYDSGQLSGDNKPYDGKAPYNIYQYEMPGQYSPGDANKPYDSLKIPTENKPYDTKAPYNIYQYEMPGQYAPGDANKPYDSLKIPTENKPYDTKAPYNIYQYEMPGQYSPGDANKPYDSLKTPTENKPYDAKTPYNIYQYEMPGQKFEIPGQYSPGEANKPYDSVKIPTENKPYDAKAPYNIYQYEMPGQYSPGETNKPYDSLKIPTENKPYDAKAPYNIYQYEIPGQKFEIPGQYSPGEANKPYGSIKISTESKPYDVKVPYNIYQYGKPGQIKNPYESLGLPIDGAKQPYGPDVTYNQYTPTDQKNSNPMPMELSQLNIKTETSKYQYGLPSLDVQRLPIGLYQQPVQVGLRPRAVQIGLQPQPVQVGLYQRPVQVDTPAIYSVGRHLSVPYNYEHQITPKLAAYPGIYPVKPGYTAGYPRIYPVKPNYMDLFRRKNQDDAQMQPEARANPLAQPMGEDQRQELFRRAMELIEKQFDKDMKEFKDEQQSTKNPDVTYRRGVTEIDNVLAVNTSLDDVPSTTNQPTVVFAKLDAQTNSPVNSSEEGYVFGISSESTDEEATLANTYSEKVNANQENYDDESGHNCESEMDYEYDDESAEELTLKPDAQVHSHSPLDNEPGTTQKYEPSTTTEEEKSQRRMINEVMDKENTTQVKEVDGMKGEELALPDTPDHDLVAINFTEVRRFDQPPDRFSNEDFEHYDNATNESANSREIYDATNNGSIVYTVDNSLQAVNTSGFGDTDNITMYYAETEDNDDKDTKVESLPENPDIEQEIFKSIEEIYNIVQDMHNITPSPVETMSLVFTTPTTIAFDENIDDNLDTGDVLHHDAMPEAVTESILFHSAEEAHPEFQTEAISYNEENIDDNLDTGDVLHHDSMPEAVTDSILFHSAEEAQPELQTEATMGYADVEAPIEDHTLHFYHSTSTFAPDIVEDFTASVAPVTFFDLFNSEEETHVEQTEGIEHAVDVTVPPPVTIADMGKDIDYLQYYGTELSGNASRIEETTTVSANLENTTINYVDSPTTMEVTTLDNEDTTSEAIFEDNQETVQPNTEAAQRRNKQSEESVEDTETDATYQNGLPFLKHKLMSEENQDDGKYENYILEEILEKPYADLTDKEKFIFERMVELTKHPDDESFDKLPEIYRPLTATDDQFLLRGLLNDSILDNDYLRKGVILLKNYPNETDVDSLKTRTILREILRDFKNEPNTTTIEEKRMNLVLSLLASHPQALDSVYETMVKTHGEPDNDELAIIDQWLRLLQYNKGIELMYLYNNNVGGSEDDFHSFLIEHLMKKEPEALTEEDQHVLDALVLIYKNSLKNRPDKEEQDILDDDLYKLGILTMYDSPNKDNLELLAQELLEYVMHKPDTDLNDWEYKVYNYLMKLAKNPDELQQRYNDVMGGVKSTLDERFIELNNGTIPRSFEEVVASLNENLMNESRADFTKHDTFILDVLRYLAKNKELSPVLANFEQGMVVNQPMYKFGIITISNSPNRHKPELLSEEILTTVLNKPREELNAKEKMMYRYLMLIATNPAYLMGTYNHIMNELKVGVLEEDVRNNKNRRYMVAIIKIPIKTQDENGDVIRNQTIKIGFDDLHQNLLNLSSLPEDNEQAVFIMPEEDSETLQPLDFDEQTKLVHKLEEIRTKLKLHRANQSEEGEVIQKKLDDLVPYLVRMLQSGSTHSLNEAGEIIYDLNDNEPSKNLQQLLGHAILLIRRRNSNSTEVDDGELIEYLTTLQRRLMTDIKSEYGTTDFNQQPVEIERRYMVDPGEFDGDSPITNIVPQRRGMMDKPIQMAMGAVAKWFAEQQTMQPANPYRRNYQPDQSFQPEQLSPTGQRRGLMDKPIQMAMNAVAKWFAEQQTMQPANPYRRNFQEQQMTDYQPVQRYQTEQDTEQRRGLMDKPIQMAMSAVAKWFAEQHPMQPAASYRRTVPEEQTTGYPIDHSSQQKAITESSRRYYEYVDSLIPSDEYFSDEYADSLRYFRRSNIEHDDNAEEETEKDGKVVPEVDTQDSPITAVNREINDGGGNRQNHTARKGNKEWSINGVQRSGETLRQESDTGDDVELLTMRRGADHQLEDEGEDKEEHKVARKRTHQGDDKELLTMRRSADHQVEDEGEEKEEHKVARKRKHRGRRQRRKHGRNLRKHRRNKHRSRNNSTQAGLVRKFSPTSTELAQTIDPGSQQGDDGNTTNNFEPSRRQLPLGMISGILPFGGGGGAPGGGGGMNPLSMLGALNPLQFFGMRRNEEESPREQVEPTRILGQDSAGPMPQMGQMNYGQQTNGYQDNPGPVPQTGQMNYGQQAIGNQDNLGQAPQTGQMNYGQQTNGYQDNPGPVPQTGQMNYGQQANGYQGNPGPVPQAGQMNYGQQAIGNQDNLGPVPQTGQMNYDQPNNGQIQTTGVQDSVTPGQIGYDQQNNVHTIENMSASPDISEPSLVPSPKQRRSADAVSILRMFNPVELVRRFNPFGPREEEPMMASSDSAAQRGKSDTGQHKPEDEQKQNQAEENVIKHSETATRRQDNKHSTEVAQDGQQKEHSVAETQDNDPAGTGSHRDRN